MLRKKHIVLEIAAHRDAQDSEILPSAVIGLNQNADMEFLAPTEIRREAVPVPPLNS